MTDLSILIPSRNDILKYPCYNYSVDTLGHEEDIMRKGQKASEELRRRLSEAHKDQIPWHKGKIIVPIEQQLENKRAYKRAWTEKNREKVREQERQRRAKNREKTNASARARYSATRDEQLSRHRVRKYGLSDEEYLQIVKEQGGACLICGDIPSINLSVDHDHKTGKIRGLICNSCNIGLAKAKDSPEILRAMADYLERFDG